MLLYFLAVSTCPARIGMENNGCVHGKEHPTHPEFHHRAVHTLGMGHHLYLRFAFLHAHGQLLPPVFEAKHLVRGPVESVPQTLYLQSHNIVRHHVFFLGLGLPPSLFDRRTDNEANRNILLIATACRGDKQTDKALLGQSRQILAAELHSW